MDKGPAQGVSYSDAQSQPTESPQSAPRVNLWFGADCAGHVNYYQGAFSMASRSSKSSPGSSGRSEAASKGAKASNRNSEAQSERAKGNTNASKRSSTGGEKKSSVSKSGK
jgi:hypothetical protein